MDFLEIRGLTKFFGGLAAVLELDMDVGQGEIVGLIGPNGAGKSTVLNMIGGTLMPSKGEVIFDGVDVTRLPSHRRAHLGIGRVFQENLLFNGFTVLENVLVGFHIKSRKSLSGIMMKTRSNRAEEEALQEKALETLAFVGLEPYADELSTNLPHGGQRLLGLAIALATQPRLLLLDEPVTGMNAEEVETMLAMIRTLREQKGITCIIIEHNLKAVMGLCERITVLNFGKKIAQVQFEMPHRSLVIMEAYLGTEEDVA